MRIFEIILKLAFLAGSIYFVLTEHITNTMFVVPYLFISFVLGIVLIINKKSSYNYVQKDKDYLIRRIEGFILIIFSFLASILFYSFMSFLYQING